MSNIFFWRTLFGYFGGYSDRIPLLHMWTLSVEEQFYIVWPVAMLVIGRIARAKGISVQGSLAAALLICGAMSLLLCGHYTPFHQTATFYFTPFRAWEFTIGSLLAIFFAERSALSRSELPGLVISAMGLTAVVVAVTWFDANTMFPGFAALLPVLGTGAILLGLLWSPVSPVGQLLSWKPMVIIGKLSYSWYLWHWPLLAIARAHALGKHSLARDLALAGLALLLSALTYILVEEPVRRRKIWPLASSRTIIAVSVLALASLVGVSEAYRGWANWTGNKDPVLRMILAMGSESFPLPDICRNYSML